MEHSFGFADFRRRFLALLGYQFKVFLPQMSLNMIKQDIFPEKPERKSSKTLNANALAFMKLTAIVQFSSDQGRS